jgi:V/A-type H+-transporting ATPase subunit I
MIRPRPARWFEVIAARDDAYLVLEALAAAGCVQIEWHAPAAAAPAGAAAALLQRYAQYAHRYGPYWPAAQIALAVEHGAPLDALAAAVAAIGRWAAEAEPRVDDLQRALAADAELQLAQAALHELAASALDFSQLARADHGVAASLFALPAEAALDWPDDVLWREVQVPSERLLLVVGAPAALERLAQAVVQAGGRQARFPSWLQPTAAENLALVAQRRAQLAAGLAALRSALAACTQRHGLAHALGEVARSRWCLEHGGAIAGESMPGALVRLSGWTVDAPALVAAVERCGARALVSYPAPPRGAQPPLTLANPWWARPFEVFVRLVGLPGERGADPSVLLALAVPLLFGYMFGDVGQGLVLVLAGFALRRRLPLLRLLIPGGLAAMAFGFVFGSVFSVEVLHPLWVAPLAQPLPVLIAPLAGGAVLLLLGLLLGAWQAHWQHELPRWLREDAPVVATYLGLLLALVAPATLWLAAAGALWAAAAAAGSARRLAAAPAALGALLERTLQLLINTLSFARVGAFALAHAGLSSAVVALAAAAGARAGTLLVLVLGNALIVLVEGLVVSIQTTRLVMFEFFTRFFEPAGREFRPLLPPSFEAAGT